MCSFNVKVLRENLIKDNEFTVDENFVEILPDPEEDLHYTYLYF